MSYFPVPGRQDLHFYASVRPSTRAIRTTGINLGRDAGILNPLRIT